MIGKGINICICKHRMIIIFTISITSYLSPVILIMAFNCLSAHLSGLFTRSTAYDPDERLWYEYLTLKTGILMNGVGTVP